MNRYLARAWIHCCPSFLSLRYFIYVELCRTVISGRVHCGDEAHGSSSQHSPDRNKLTWVGFSPPSIFWKTSWVDESFSQCVPPMSTVQHDLNKWPGEMKKDLQLIPATILLLKFTIKWTHKESFIKLGMYSCGLSNYWYDVLKFVVAWKNPSHFDILTCFLKYRNTAHFIYISKEGDIFLRSREMCFLIRTK